MPINPTENPDFIQLTGKKLDELLVMKQAPIDAIPTPLPAWNHRCRDFGGGIGLARGWHVTIGGNTGSGKSVLALNVAHVAVEHGEKVGFLTLEMFWTQLATRYMAIASGEKIDSLEPGARLNAEAHRRASRAIDELKERTKGTLWCNKQRISTLDDVLCAMDYLYGIRGCRLIIVDYMQLAKVIGISNLLEAVTMISGEVRGFGSQYRLVTVGLSQYNRETSKDYENPPTPQGLMGGSPIENDSDQVLLIDHTNYERNTLTNTARQKCILGKNRHGPAGSIDCIWEYDSLRIREEAPVYQGPTSDRGEAWEPEELPLEVA